MSQSRENTEHANSDDHFNISICYLSLMSIITSIPYNDGKDW